MTNLTGSLDTALTLKNPWAVVPSLGHLDAYISAVNRMPMLTPEQEQEFARKLRNENDLEAAGKLVLSHLRVVVSVARQYLGYGLPHADDVGQAFRVNKHLDAMVFKDHVFRGHFVNILKFVGQAGATGGFNAQTHTDAFAALGDVA